MNKEELDEILNKHKLWLRSNQLEGNRANLSEAYLREADLREADLREAYLREADLSEADLREADLREAYLRGANLREADLREAYLRGANLRGKNHIRIYNFAEYNCYRLNNFFRAGCQIHEIEKWKNFSDDEILKMDGEKALKFYKEILLKIIDL